MTSCSMTLSSDRSATSRFNLVFSSRSCLSSRASPGSMLPSEARELKQLRDENTKLKRLVADLSLDKVMLQDVIQKKF